MYVHLLHHQFTNTLCTYIFQSILGNTCIHSSEVACEGNVRYYQGDGNLHSCIEVNIMNGNQYIIWYYNQCYGTNTCDDPYDIEGVVNIDVRCPGKFI